MKEFLSEDNMSNKKNIKDFNIYSKKFYKKQHYLPEISVITR